MATEFSFFGFFEFEIEFLQRLTTVEIIRQQKGCASSLRLQISALTCDECGAIPWDELQVYLLSFAFADSFNFFY